VAATGRQIGFIFPVGNMQGHFNLKGYWEFAAENRPDGWNAWVTFSLSNDHEVSVRAIRLNAPIQSRT
jgi:hypothetical protein